MCGRTRPASPGYLPPDAKDPACPYCRFRDPHLTHGPPGVPLGHPAPGEDCPRVGTSLGSSAVVPDLRPRRMLRLLSYAARPGLTPTRTHTPLCSRPSRARTGAGAMLTRPMSAAGGQPGRQGDQARRRHRTRWGISPAGRRPDRHADRAGPAPPDPARRDAVLRGRPELRLLRDPCGACGGPGGPGHARGAHHQPARPWPFPGRAQPADRRGGFLHRGGGRPGGGARRTRLPGRRAGGPGPGAGRPHPAGLPDPPLSPDRPRRGAADRRLTVFTRRPPAARLRRPQPAPLPVAGPGGRPGGRGFAQAARGRPGGHPGGHRGRPATAQSQQRRAGRRCRPDRAHRHDRQLRPSCRRGRARRPVRRGLRGFRRHGHGGHRRHRNRGPGRDHLPDRELSRLPGGDLRRGAR